MRFLIDVCAGRRLADWLRAKGFEVIIVADTDKRMAEMDADLRIRI